jgi:hypothetical protein
LFALKRDEIEIRNGTTPEQKSTADVSSKLGTSAIKQILEIPGVDLAQVIPPKKSI